jgi:hypothetical protein
MQAILTFAILLFCTASLALGQQGLSVKGIVVDENKVPLEFVNAVLLQKSDSAFVAGSTTDSQGSFSMAIKGGVGQYLLKISFIGYQPSFVQVDKVDVGTIVLRPNTQMLSGVEVVADALRFKMSHDGITASVQNSRLSDLGTAMEVLGQLPFVNAKDETLTVFGKGTPVVYINNHRVYGDTDLNKLSSSDIKNISVILNPGAEYPADVKSVIKIETVKKVGEGLSGYAKGSFTKSRKEAGAEQVDLTYRHKGMDMSGGLYLNQMLKTFYFDQNTDYDNLDASIVDNTRTSVNDRWLEPYGSISYTWKDKHSLGAKFQHSQYAHKAYPKGLLDVRGTDVKEETQQTQSKERWGQYRDYLNAYYYGELASWLSIKWNADFAYGHTRKTQDVTNKTSDDIEYIFTGSRMNYRLFATKLVLDTPCWDGKWTYGGEYSYTDTQQRFDTNETGEEHYLTPSRTTIKESSSAFFAQYERTFGRFSAMAGLRYERVLSDYYEGGRKVDEQSRTYHNLMPNISLSYQNGMQASLTFSRSTTRPGYYALRSSTDYVNNYMYDMGSPGLQPILSDELDLTLQWKDLQAEVHYSILERDYDAISYQSEKDKAVVISQNINFEHGKNLWAYVAYTPTIGVWHPTLEGSVEKQFRKYVGLTFNKPIYDVALKNAFVLSKRWTLGLDADVYTSGYRYFDYRYGMFRLDAYVVVRLLKDALILNLRGNDILHTEKDKTLTAMNHITTLNTARRDTRDVRISVTYRFNATKSKYKGEQASKEMNRL